MDHNCLLGSFLQLRTLIRNLTRWQPLRLQRFINWNSVQIISKYFLLLSRRHSQLHQSFLMHLCRPAPHGKSEQFGQENSAKISMLSKYSISLNCWIASLLTLQNVKHRGDDFSFLQYSSMRLKVFNFDSLYINWSFFFFH